MSSDHAPPVTPTLRQRCRDFVMAASERYRVPPAYIVAHTRAGRSDAARTEVMRRMVGELGMRRWQVAEAFGRDLRRVRKSVIGV
jgi:hypothetical protein